jgi:predicted DsbA family dithiol-disulfide isomerase
VEIVIHEMPIISPQSREAALVSAAAARMDPRRALDLYLAVGSHEGRLDGAAMIEKAAGLGFDREALRREAEREETARTVNRSLDLARRLGVSGTPGFVAQDLLIQGLQPEQVLQALARPR